ncbi:hypothetical protein QYF61_019043 [Mycteria americana]|uniref:Uncharacterized protein n=1 Tax=Mycteria americana TaxID=33587 RepID=A0AAN7S8A8_MYCAM|nr:hypothetical protein QYF61_019043 [Mycteria americana]
MGRGYGWESQVSWFSPSRQLSTTQPLAHSPPVGWGRESEEQNFILSMTSYAWGPSYRRQSSMNFSNVSPSHGLQFFMNCSSMGPFHGVQSFRNRLLQRGSPMGSQVLPVNLLQHGFLSPQVHRPTGPARSLLQHGLPMGSQPPSGIHLLRQGVLHGLQVDICSTVNLHGPQGDSLPHHGLHYRLQGNLCSGTWSTSTFSSSLTLILFAIPPGEGAEGERGAKPVENSMVQVKKDNMPSRYGGWRLNHFPGQPVPMLDNPFSEEKFPNIQSKPPLAQLEAISSRPITCYLGEETDPHLSTTSFQAKPPQLPQPLLIRLLLQTLHQLRCPSLDTLQHLNVSLVVGGPKLNTVVEVRPHQCRVQGHDHFPSPAGHAIFDTSQDAIGFLGHLGTLLAHIQDTLAIFPKVALFSFIRIHEDGNQDTEVDICGAQALFPVSSKTKPSPVIMLCSCTARESVTTHQNEIRLEALCANEESKSCTAGVLLCPCRQPVFSSSPRTEPVALAVTLPWFNPSRQLSTMQPLAHSPPAKQPQLPQPLLIRLLLQTLHQLRCPSLDTLQHLNVSLVVGGPKLNTVFEVRPHQCRVQGHDHFPSPAGHTIPDTSQDAVGLLGHLGTLLAHIQAAVNQHPQRGWRSAMALLPNDGYSMLSSDGCSEPASNQVHLALGARFTTETLWTSRENTGDVGEGATVMVAHTRRPLGLARNSKTWKCHQGTDNRSSRDS